MLTTSPQQRFVPKFIGRTKELGELKQYLDDAMQGVGKTVFISGEAGIGKTGLVDKLCDYAISKDVQVLKGACTSHLLHPFFPIMDMLEELTPEKIIYREEEEYFTVIDEIFLINNASIPMVHVSRKGRTLGEQIIGSMLSAVQDFVKDSFGDKSKVSALDRLDYGTKKILIEHGAYTFIACVIEGEVHNNLRVELRNAVKHIENAYYDVISAWDGDLSKVEDIRRYLIPLSRKKYAGRRALEGEKLEAKRIRLYENVTQLLIKHLKKPMVLLIDDIHWAEEAGLLMLQYIARSTRDSKLLICCTYRTEELSPRLRKILEKIKQIGLAEELSLKPLAKADVTKLIRSFFHASYFSEGFFDDMYEKCGGNPFYAKELVHTLCAEKTIHKVNRKWQIDPTMKFKLPVTVVEAVSRRLDQLSAEAIRIVECAATIGSDIPLDLLSLCLAIEKSKLSPAFANIEAYKIMHLEDEENMVYQFEHAITREVIYDGMSERWRRLTHRTIGSTLEAIHKDDLDVVVYQLAHHYFKGRSIEKALDYSIKAGEKAQNTFAPENSTEYYEMALTALSEVPGSESKENLKLKLEIITDLSSVEFISGKEQPAIEHYQNAIDLCQQLDLKNKLAELYSELSEIYIARSEWDHAQNILNLAMTISNEIDDELGSANAYRRLGSVSWGIGKISDAEKMLDRGLEIAERLDNKPLLAKLYMEFGAIFNLRGDYKKSIELMMKSLRISEDINDKYDLAKAYNNIGDVYAVWGETENAIKWFEKCVKISREIGTVGTLAFALANLAENYVKINELDMAEANCREALRIFERTGEKNAMGWCHKIFGMIHGQNKRWDLAIANFEHFRKMVEEANEAQDLSLGYYEYAKMWQTKGDFAKAIEFYERSISVYESLGNMKKVEEIKNVIENICD